MIRPCLVMQENVAQPYLDPVQVHLDRNAIRRAARKVHGREKGRVLANLEDRTLRRAVQRGIVSASK
jgi:hypothetical protein